MRESFARLASNTGLFETHANSINSVAHCVEPALMDNLAALQADLRAVSDLLQARADETGPDSKELRELIARQKELRARIEEIRRRSP